MHDVGGVFNAFESKLAQRNQRIDAAHIDAEPDDVALEYGLVRARVEQKRVL